MQERHFWENTFAKQSRDTDVAESDFDPQFLELIGDPANKRCLDVGCGSGELACLLASKGAKVIGIDGAKAGISRARERARAHNLGEATTFLEGDLMHLQKMVSGEFDLIIGKFVLHHLEPFEQFVESLHPLLSPRGAAVFYENSADNVLLMWARKNLVGKFGIPKFGDDHEVPLSRAETDLAKQWFDVEVIFPNFVFFGMFQTYLMRSRFIPRALKSLPALADQLVYRYASSLRRYSYHKIVCLRKPGVSGQS